MEREGGVEDVRGGEEETEGGDGSDAAGESDGETGGSAREQNLEERTDEFEVRKVKKGKRSKKHSMKKKKHYGLPLIYSIDRIDLSPIPTGTVHRFTHFPPISALKNPEKQNQIDPEQDSEI